MKGLVKAFLVLEDGTVFKGTPFGALGERLGTVVFNTGVVGYEKILTDPACKGNIIVMTYPLIGNYGVNHKDLESETCHGTALVVRDLSRNSSNFRAEEGLNDFLKRCGVIGIANVDTRALTIHIRENGEMRGIIVTVPNDTETIDIDSLLSKIRSYNPVLSGEIEGERFNIKKSGNSNLHVVAIDLGVQRSSLQQFERLGCYVTLVPAGTKARDIIDMEPDGIFISSGPEDETLITKVAEELKPLLGKKPIFGIGTGNLVLGCALRGRIKRMKCGHRGANYAVKNIENGRLDITLQNHGYVLDENSLPYENVQITWGNLVDGTIEGISANNIRAFSLQYIPNTMERGTVSKGFKEFKEELLKSKAIGITERDGDACAKER